MKKDRKNRWLVTLIFLVILFTTLPWGALGEASLGAARMDVFLRNSVHTLISSSFAVVFSYALLRVFRGEATNASFEVTSGQKQRARTMALAGCGLLLIASLASVFPYLGSVSYGAERYLLLGATLVSTLGIICLSVMQHAQANLYWPNLRSYKDLDERQVRERLIIIQNAYVYSTILLIVFLCLAVLYGDTLVRTAGDMMRGNGTLNTSWQALINTLVAVIWMPGIVAAFSKRHNA